MAHEGANWRMIARCAAPAAAALALACFTGAAADAQSFMRSPNLNIAPRIPTIHPNVAGRVNANVAGRVNGANIGSTNVVGRVNGANVGSANVAGGANGANIAGHVNSDGPVRVYTNTAGTNVAGHVNTVTVTGAANPPVHANAGPTIAPVRDTGPRLTPGIAVIPQLPYVRYSPNLYPVCSSAYRDSDGECLDQPILAGGGGGGGGGPARTSKNGAPRANAVQAVLNSRTIAGEIVAEIDGALSDGQADELARRHGLTRIGSQNFPLIGATIGLFRITDRRSVETVSREFAAEAGVRSVQPNFRYLLQEAKTVPGEGDPAQYALPKLRLPEAHVLSRGAQVRIAVIDSGIDVRHPELAGSIAETFDALASREGAHVHGTGIAGAIVAHAQLMGAAPAAQLLAIRAFGQSPKGAESNSFVILKALDYAAMHGAQIVNMSFAGPKDALIERGIAATATRGIAMIAAAGNAGAKSPPLYPAANPNVIAVSATDAEDRLFAASNRGSYIALAAPGVDIFLPAPDDKYQMTSGTSFSAAFVSGVAALVLARNPALRSEELRAILMKTAHDLGSPGRDDLFGAGEADAYAAVQAVTAQPSTPVAASEPPNPRETAPEQKETPAIRALSPSVTTMAAEKPAPKDSVRPSAQ
jgi:subtilisin family serine protease